MINRQTLLADLRRLVGALEIDLRQRVDEDPGVAAMLQQEYDAARAARRTGAALEEWNARLQLEGSYEKGVGRLYLKTNTDYRYSSFTGGAERTTIFEGYGTLKPSDSWKLEVGKKNLKWGKGYAWNPVNFLDRAKDPNDPEQSIEGNIMATMDYIRSFDGPLKTLSFTPVLFPVYDHMNDLRSDDHPRILSQWYRIQRRRHGKLFWLSSSGI